MEPSKAGAGCKLGYTTADALSLAPTTVAECEYFLRREEFGVNAQFWLSEKCDVLRIVIKGQNEHGDEIKWSLVTGLSLSSRKERDETFARVVRQAHAFWLSLNRP